MILLYAGLLFIGAIVVAVLCLFVGYVRDWREAARDYFSV